MSNAGGLPRRGEQHNLLKPNKLAANTLPPAIQVTPPQGVSPEGDALLDALPQTQPLRDGSTDTPPQLPQQSRIPPSEDDILNNIITGFKNLGGGKSSEEEEGTTSPADTPDTVDTVPKNDFKEGDVKATDEGGEPLIETEEGTYDDYLREYGNQDQAEPVINPPQSGMVEVERSYAGLSPESKEMYAQAENNYSTIQSSLTELEGKIDQEKYQSLESTFNNYIEQTGDDFEKFNKGVGQLQDEMDQIGENIEKISKLEVDPDRYMNNMPASKKVLLGLMTFMEGMSNSFDNKEGNYYVENLHRNIENDVRQQEQGILEQKEVENVKSNILQEKLKKFGDMYTAKKAVEAESLASALKKIESKAAADKNGLFAQRAELVLAEGGRKLAEIQSDTMNSKMSRIMQEDIQQQDVMDTIDPSTVVNIDGKLFTAVDKESAAKARDFTLGYGVVVDTISDMEAIREKHGNKLITALTAKSTLESKKSSLMRALNAMEDTNLSKDLYQELVKQIGDPTAILDFNSNLGLVKEDLQNRMDAMMDTAGLYNTGVKYHDWAKRRLSQPAPK